MDQITKNQPTQISQGSLSDEINLLDYWVVIRKRKGVILSLFLVSVVGASIISLFMTPIYQAKATLMPIESSQNKLSMALGSLQDIPFVGGSVSGALGKTTTDKLVTILNSRTVAEDVIRKLDLIKKLFDNQWDVKSGKWNTDTPPTMQDTINVMQAGIAKIIDDKKGLISISAESKNPKLAADIANEYASSLQRFLNVNAISLAKRNRLFLERQLQITKADLQISEEKLKSYQTRKKIVAMDAQAEGSIKALAAIKAEIIGREVQLGAMREYATKAHPDLKRMEDELRELRSQLNRLETGSKNPNVDGSIGSVISLTEAPTLGLDYARLRRDALVQQKVFELLTQQYEMAKIEESKDDVAFQVIDPAVPPEKRIKPKRTQNVLVAGAISLCFGILLAIVLEFLAQRKVKPQPLP